MSDYYNSPLNWENLKVGTCFGEKSLGDVVYIKEIKETKYDNEYYIIDSYDNSDIEDNLRDGNPLVHRNRKISYDGWLMIGYADWEYKEIKPSEFNKYVIKSYIRKHMETHPYEEDIFGLFQNIPNPLKNTTTIGFNLKQESNCELTIFNIKGEIVKTLFRNNTKSGEFNWNGKNEKGNEVFSGIYFYKLSTENETFIKKMILTK